MVKALQYVNVEIIVSGYTPNNLCFADGILAMCHSQQGLQTAEELQK